MNGLPLIASGPEYGSLWGDGNRLMAGAYSQVYSLAGSQWSLAAAGGARPDADSWSIEYKHDGSLAAVGDGGALVTFDGRGWSETTLGTIDLLSVWGTATDGLFVGGEQGLLLWSHGTSWSAIETKITDDLRMIRGTQGGDVLVVSSSGKVYRVDQSG